MAHKLDSTGATPSAQRTCELRGCYHAATRRITIYRGRVPDWVEVCDGCVALPEVQAAMVPPPAAPIPDLERASRPSDRRRPAPITPPAATRPSLGLLPGGRGSDTEERAMARYRAFLPPLRLDPNPDKSPRLCRLDGCQEPVKARGLCGNDLERCRTEGVLDDLGLPPRGHNQARAERVQPASKRGPARPSVPAASSPAETEVVATTAATSDQPETEAIPQEAAASAFAATAATVAQRIGLTTRPLEQLLHESQVEESTAPPTTAPVEAGTGCGAPGCEDGYTAAGTCLVCEGMGEDYHQLLAPELNVEAPETVAFAVEASVDPAVVFAGDTPEREPAPITEPTLLSDIIGEAATREYVERLVAPDPDGERAKEIERLRSRVEELADEAMVSGAGVEMVLDRCREFLFDLHLDLSAVARRAAKVLPPVELRATAQQFRDAADASELLAELPEGSEIAGITLFVPSSDGKASRMVYLDRARREDNKAYQRVADAICHLVGTAIDVERVVLQKDLERMGVRHG